MDTPAPRGRPRSEEAREAVIHAVDDLLVEVGYEAMTMKGIAERAGVGRQTLYRWWSTKAEILFEACVHDARRDLLPEGAGGLDAYLERLETFLTTNDAGASYLALLAAAQLDPAVADLLRDADPVRGSARAALEAAGELPAAEADRDASVARLIGPMIFGALTRV